MVLVAPALLLAVTAVFQAMVYFHALQVARMAADDGLQATQGRNGSENAGQRRATDLLDQFGRPLTSQRVEVSRDATTASVHVTGHVAMLLPGFRLPVEATATGPVSVFKP
jgi:hypothetical protein